LCEIWRRREARCSFPGLSKWVPSSVRFRESDAQISLLSLYGVSYKSGTTTDDQTEVTNRLREQFFEDMDLDIAAQYIPSLGFLICIGKVDYDVQIPHGWDLTVNPIPCEKRVTLRPVRVGGDAVLPDKGDTASQCGLWRFGLRDTSSVIRCLDCATTDCQGGSRRSSKI